jgi:hypothetical protein
VRNLAELHLLDPASLNLPHLEIPATAAGVAFNGKFEPAERRYRRPHVRAEPLLEYAAAWVHRNVPDRFDRVSLIHGDAGPGQFLFEGSVLTGIIDWERAHFSTGMADLGQLRLRSTLYRMGDVGGCIEHYEDVDGAHLDLDHVRFFTVLSACSFPMRFAGLVQAPVGSNPMTVPVLGWEATIRRVLVEALAETAGVMLHSPELPVDSTNPRESWHDLLSYQLASRASLDENADGARSAVAAAVRRSDSCGAALDNDDVADVRKTLGVSCRSVDGARVALMEAVSDPVRSDPHRLLPLLYRLERRREFLRQPFMVGQDLSGSLLPLEIDK